MSVYNELNGCRVSGSKHLISVLNLGVQTLTGVFPRPEAANVPRGPLELVWCPDSGLVQLRHSYNLADLYGDHYGYRSGLNQSMVQHLTHHVCALERLVEPSPGDVVLDIGSNDGTLLGAYSRPGLNRVGIDPTGEKFRRYYRSDVTLIPEFFSADSFRAAQPKPAKIVTSFSMFYDLEAPIDFAKQVADILADDGVWHFEQSYMPSMLRTNSYDTICHEHLEYYSLEVVNLILDAAGLQITDVATNAVNGGSFAVTATHRSNTRLRPNRPVIDWLLAQEDRMGLKTPRPYRDFEERVFRHREDFTRLIRGLVADGKKLLGYGASTKGNVLLQFCGLSSNEIGAIAEVNTDKFGCVTPGTNIPIISEAEAHAMEPDYFIVLPWHFRDSILRREKDFLLRGGKFIFPFPEIEIA